VGNPKSEVNKVERNLISTDETSKEGGDSFTMGGKEKWSRGEGKMQPRLSILPGEKWGVRAVRLHCPGANSLDKRDRKGGN